MLLLSQESIIKTVNLDEMISVIENAMLFADGGNFEMPLRISVSLNEKDSLMLMPCITPDAWGCKLLTLRSDNPIKGLPFIDGAVILFDETTGKPKALLEGKTVTAIRTGAIGGAGIKNTAPDDITSLGLVGAGAQGYWQAQYGCVAKKNIKEVWVYDSFMENLSSFKERLQAVLPDKSINIANNTSELLANTQAVMTATPSKQPVFPNDARLLADHAFSGIGSYTPEMREYPDTLFELVGSGVYIDTPHALKETGDLITPMKNGLLKQENIHTLSELISGKSKKTSSTTFFKSVGMALFDLVCADYLCGKAKGKGIGVVVDF
ncbi:MAG: ornithine cyclodeaminase family protein [Synergistaceae bacterium]|nr:ornithine cyclodeaminase family protein [Synergistaceae bacterium]